jgi:hypothetical protein
LSLHVFQGLGPGDRRVNLDSGNRREELNEVF